MGDFLKQHSGAVGTGVGAGLGALLAIPTGGLSIPAGASLGMSLGAGAGNAAQSAFGSGVENLAQQPNDVNVQHRQAVQQLLMALMQGMASQQQQAPQPIQMESMNQPLRKLGGMG